MSLLKHEHLIIRAECKKPPVDTEFIDNWMKTLIKKINMKLLLGPISAYVDVPGNKGLTCVAIIETSHVAIHVWDEKEPGLVQLDVYSCSTVDPETVLDHIQEFEPVKVEYKFLDREHNLKELPQGEK